MFTRWYFMSFGDRGSPFGFSAGLDLKTMYAVKAGVTVTCAMESQMPEAVLSAGEHAHRADR